jgi:hypothetical protein
MLTKNYNKKVLHFWTLLTLSIIIKESYAALGIDHSSHISV